VVSVRRRAWAVLLQAVRVWCAVCVVEYRIRRAACGFVTRLACVTRVELSAVIAGVRAASSTTYRGGRIIGALSGERLTCSPPRQPRARPARLFS